jgi:hypothetical protein
MNPNLCVSLIRANLLVTHPNIQFDCAIKFDNTGLWIEVINNNTLSLAFEHKYAQIYTDLSIEEFLIELGKRKKIKSTLDYNCGKWYNPTTQNSYGNW